MAALNDLDPVIRARLSRLWIEYADGLAVGGHTDTARLFAELSLVTSAGTTEQDHVDAEFSRILTGGLLIDDDPAD